VEATHAKSKVCRTARARLGLHERGRRGRDAGGSKLPPEPVFDVIGGPQVKWTLVPENTMKYASFMYDVGIVKAVPSTWKELFFFEIQRVGGSRPKLRAPY
jgi:hypothetical protein